MDLPTLPIDWKKVVATTWNPTIQKAQSIREKALEVTEISRESTVKALEIREGQQRPNIHPIVQTTLPAAVASQKVRFSLSSLPAP